MNNFYLCLDLKSFYASVECVLRGYDPLKVNLVVADEARSDKSICLAISPSLKSYGIKGRPRLFEVKAQVNKINYNKKSINKSFYIEELNNDQNIKLDFIVAKPQMAYYIEYSSKIYEVYLKYFDKKDIHVYSIDEVFINLGPYLKLYDNDYFKITKILINDILKSTKITATAGIGTNLFLAKVAMDILAKKSVEDIKIGYLDEELFKYKLWEHEPITDFWRIGHGYAKKLAKYNMFTMGDIAKCSLNKLNNISLLYKLFGVNAELLIDHAWGQESCCFEDIKSYKPSFKSLGHSQVLFRPYSFDEALIVFKEMIEQCCYSLVSKKVMSKSITFMIGYDTTNLDSEEKVQRYKGEYRIDSYGRKVPKHTVVTVNFTRYTSSETMIKEGLVKNYLECVDSSLAIRRISISANKLGCENLEIEEKRDIQLNLFIDYEEQNAEKIKLNIELKKENNLQNAILNIKAKYGKNSIIKLSSLQDGATAKDRNMQIGGHNA